MINGKSQFFLKYENDFPIGFAQCQLRYDYVEGTKSSPVGYLEGIFVKEGYRSKGYFGAFPRGKAGRCRARAFAAVRLK